MRIAMQINITTQYNIGDILYLQQTNGGGLQKVQVVNIILTLGEQYSAEDIHISYTLNKPVNIVKNSIIRRLKASVYAKEMELLERTVYARRGNTWLTEKPPEKRKPLTPQTLKYWVRRNA
jgi:hypothetical protein